MNDSLLEIRDLVLQNNRTGKVIISGISLSLKKGRVTGIVGESGSGKSITALAILGLLPAPLKIRSGTILLSGTSEPGAIDLISPGTQKNARGKKITMIFQEPMTSLNPSMLCGKQLDESLKYHSKLNRRERKKKILEWLSNVKLADPQAVYNSYPHQLSGGQRQRVMIAMALAPGPELLIADEPTTALDVTVQKEIIQLLKELQVEFDLTVMFITHDLRILSEIAQDIIVMRKGEIIEYGKVQNILHNAHEPYTKALLACQPDLNSRPEKLLTVQDFENGNIRQYPDRKKVISEVPVLTINNLDLHYQSALWGRNKPHHALKNISLQVFKGETLGLVGESGCGKTSLGKTILGLIRSASGDILYHEVNLQKLTKQQRRKLSKNIQVVFQDPYSSLNPLFKVRTMLLEARKIHFPSEIREKSIHFIENLVEKIGLGKEALDKYPHEFSGGQRQRIGIARALAVEPEFLILDEAVSALDVSVQAQILNLLNVLKTEFELSYLFISHDLAVVRYMSDRVVVMKDGEIIESGDPDELYRDPQTDFTKKLISAIPGNTSYQNSSGSS